MRGIFHSLRKKATFKGSSHTCTQIECKEELPVSQKKTLPNIMTKKNPEKDQRREEVKPYNYRILQARRDRLILSKCWKENYQTGMPYLEKLCFRSEGERWLSWAGERWGRSLTSAKSYLAKMLKRNLQIKRTLMCNTKISEDAKVTYSHTWKPNQPSKAWL